MPRVRVRSSPVVLLPIHSVWGVLATVDQADHSPMMQLTIASFAISEADNG